MKLDDFITGKWYKVNFSDDKIGYFKAGKRGNWNQGDGISFTDLIQYNKYRKGVNPEESYIINDNWFRKASLLEDIYEIFEYLPSNHPDLFIDIDKSYKQLIKILDKLKIK